MKALLNCCQRSSAVQPQQALIPSTAATTDTPPTKLQKDGKAEPFTVPTMPSDRGDLQHLASKTEGPAARATAAGAPASKDAGGIAERVKLETATAAATGAPGGAGDKKAVDSLAGAGEVDLNSRSVLTGTGHDPSSQRSSSGGAGGAVGSAIKTVATGTAAETAPGGVSGLVTGKETSGSERRGAGGEGSVARGEVLTAAVGSEGDMRMHEEKKQEGEIETGEEKKATAAVAVTAAGVAGAAKGGLGGEKKAEDATSSPLPGGVMMISAAAGEPFIKGEGGEETGVGSSRESTRGGARQREEGDPTTKKSGMQEAAAGKGGANEDTSAGKETPLSSYHQEGSGEMMLGSGMTRQVQQHLSLEEMLEKKWQQLQHYLEEEQLFKAYQYLLLLEQQVEHRLALLMLAIHGYPSLPNNNNNPENPVVVVVVEGQEGGGGEGESGTTAITTPRKGKGIGERGGSTERKNNLSFLKVEDSAAIPPAGAAAAAAAAGVAEKCDTGERKIASRRTSLRQTKQTQQHQPEEKNGKKEREMPHEGMEEGGRGGGGIRQQEKQEQPSDRLLLQKDILCEFQKKLVSEQTLKNLRMQMTIFHHMLLEFHLDHLLQACEDSRLSCCESLVSTADESEQQQLLLQQQSVDTSTLHPGEGITPAPAGSRSSSRIPVATGPGGQGKDLDAAAQELHQQPQKNELERTGGDEETTAISEGKAGKRKTTGGSGRRNSGGGGILAEAGSLLHLQHRASSGGNKSALSHQSKAGGNTGGGRNREDDGSYKQTLHPHAGNMGMHGGTAKGHSGAEYSSGAAGMCLDQAQQEELTQQQQAATATGGGKAGGPQQQHTGLPLLSERKLSSSKTFRQGLRSVVGRKMSFGKRSGGVSTRRSAVKKIVTARKKQDDEGWLRERGHCLDLAYRVEKDSSVSMKVRGKLPCMLFQVLAILNETDLAATWAPFFKSAEREYQYTKASQLVRQVYDYPLLGAKETMMFCVGVNALEEGGCVCIFCHSPPENAVEFMGLPVPPPGGGHNENNNKAAGGIRSNWVGGGGGGGGSKIPRIQSADLVFLLFPISEGRRTTLELFGNFHHGLRFVPMRLITFVVKKIVRSMFVAIAKQCQQFQTGPYKERVERDPAFYGWMQQKIEDYVQQKRKSNARPPLLAGTDSAGSLASFNYEEFQDWG